MKELKQYLIRCCPSIDPSYDEEKKKLFRQNREKFLKLYGRREAGIHFPLNVPAVHRQADSESAARLHLDPDSYPQPSGARRSKVRPALQ